MSDRVATLLIPGMHCGECVRKVAEALLGVEGVDDVEVDLDTKLAEVQLTQAGPAGRQDLIQAVEDAGFAVDRVVMPQGR